MNVTIFNPNKKMFRSADDIPPTSISQAKGPMTIEMMEAVDPSIVKKVLRTQELGLYEETPEILKAANLLERFTKKVKGKRVIDYERAEAILGVPLRGDETINDLFKILPLINLTSFLFGEGTFIIVLCAFLLNHPKLVNSLLLFCNVSINHEYILELRKLFL